jgi:hypothetical protein
MKGPNQQTFELSPFISFYLDNALNTLKLDCVIATIGFSTKEYINNTLYECVICEKPTLD